MPDFTAGALDVAAAEIEQFVGASGWDQRPALFALVRASDLGRDDPSLAGRLGLDDVPGDALTPIEQETLPDGELDELLGRIAWPESVAGCALAHEIVILPPSAEAELANASDADVTVAANHPDRREARLVVAVLRDGTSAAVLRLRSETDDELLTGPDLAPNLVAALVATLTE
jgi:hypothetical protein